MASNLVHAGHGAADREKKVQDIMREVAAESGIPFEDMACVSRAKNVDPGTLIRDLKYHDVVIVDTLGRSKSLCAILGEAYDIVNIIATAPDIVEQHVDTETAQLRPSQWRPPFSFVHFSLDGVTRDRIIAANDATVAQLLTSIQKELPPGRRMDKCLVYFMITTEKRLVVVDGTEVVGTYRMWKLRDIPNSTTVFVEQPQITFRVEYWPTGPAAIADVTIGNAETIGELKRVIVSALPAVLRGRLSRRRIRFMYFSKSSMDVEVRGRYDMKLVQSLTPNMEDRTIRLVVPLDLMARLPRPRAER